MQQKQLPRVTSPSMPPPQSFASKLGNTIADISASGKMTSLGLEHLLMTTVGYEQQFTVNRVGFLESRSLLNLNGSLVSNNFCEIEQGATSRPKVSVLYTRPQTLEVHERCRL